LRPSSRDRDFENEFAGAGKKHKSRPYPGPGPGSRSISESTSLDKRNYHRCIGIKKFSFMTLEISIPSLTKPVIL
jgi:hypothetical protein